MRSITQWSSTFGRNQLFLASTGHLCFFYVNKILTVFKSILCATGPQVAVIL